jgi:cell division protein ZapA
MSAQTTRHDGEFVTVSIYDQTYHLRGHNPAYIERLAELVDGKMRAVASHGATVDSLRVAVLAALNIADELMMANARLETLTGAETRERNRAHSLTGLLDEVLESAPGAAFGNKRRAG